MKEKGCIMGKKAKKIVLSHTKVEVKVLLEVLAIYVIFAVVIIGLYYLNPTIPGIFITPQDYDTKQINLSDNSDVIITTMFSLAIISIVALQIYNLVSSKGKKKSKLLKKVKEIREESKKFQNEKKLQSDLEKWEQLEAKKDVRRYIIGKSRLFIKCHRFLLKASNALENNNIRTAKNHYFKTRNSYIKLEYHEKKELYKELSGIYNKLIGAPTHNIQKK